MKNRNQIEVEDNFIDQRVAETFGYGDEQLENELDDAVAAAEENGYRAPEGELERIMNRLESRPVPRRKVVRIRRVVKTLIAAAILGTMVVGGGMWVGAKRYYVQEVREQEDIDNVVINNNIDNLMFDNISEIKKAYAQIEEKLNIQALELSYLSENMAFHDFVITSKKGVIEFSDGERTLFWVQGQNDKPSSFSYASDAQECKKAYNVYFDKEFPIYEENLENGKIEFGIRIIQDKAYYILYGIIDIEEFEKIVYGIRPYKDYSSEE